MLYLAAVVASFWLVQLVLAFFVVRRVRPTASLSAPTLAKYPRLSILVPARDEAFGIEGALASKLKTTYPDVELIAINDRSADDTPVIIDTIAAADPRVRAVHIDSLPDGWLGKLHAMQRGLDAATGEWVLFSDADVHIEPGVLERLLAVAETERLDMIAVFPKMRPVNWWIDAAVASLTRILMLAGRAWRANDDRSPIGAGVGAFNLVRRSKLEETRAIEELKMEVADDVALGALIKQSGGRCRLYAGQSEVHLVFLDSWRAAVRSVDKGGGALGYSLLVSLFLAIVPISVEVLLPIAAVLEGGAAAIAGAAALLFATSTHFLLVHHFGAPLFGVFTWPIGQMLNAGLTLRSGLRAWKLQGVYWRDTFYRREVLDAGRRLKLSSLRVERKSITG